MKAAFFEAHGGPEVLQVGEFPDPVCGPDDLLVDIHAASVNGADWKVRAGRSGTLEKFPHILGRDFSGTVAEVGANVSGFAPGDAVFAVLPGGQEGTYAEKVAVPASVVAPKPDSLTHMEAAAVALVSLTAIISVEDTLGLKPGEKILIQGGAGGVASIAIRLAKHIGAHVVTTCSTGNIDYVSGFGPDEIVDYTTTDFVEAVSGCDAVFETVGGEVATRSFDVLKPGGRIAFIASGPKAPPAPRADIQSLRPQVGRSRAEMERIARRIAEGAIRVPEIARLTLDDVVEAHRISEGRHLRGKLVFEIR